MPVYDFFCDADHATPWLGSYGDRPIKLACQHCGEPAAYRPTLSSLPPSSGGTTKEDRWSGLAYHLFRCQDCGGEEDVVVDFKAGETTDPRKCETCGGEVVVQYTTRIDRFSERFPYFDRGLGCVVTSRRDRLAKARARGLVPLDGDIDLGAILRKQADEDARRKTSLRSLEDRYEYSPAFRQYREMRDKGAFSERPDDFADEQLTPLSDL